jgi:hypothetical protein
VHGARHEARWTGARLPLLLVARVC